MMIGLYRIRNVINGHCYYGSSINLSIRGRQHFRLLRLGQHGNPRLQRAWDKYGEKNFRHEVIVILERTDLLDTETRLLPYGEYNISLIAEAPMRGRKHSAATLAKMSVAAKKRGVSEEGLRKLQEGRAKIPRASKEELRKRLSDRRRKTPEEKAEGFRRIAEANRSRVFSEETRRKMSESAKRAWERKRGAS